MSLSSQDNQSILHKLLPNASSPIKFGLTNKKFMSLSIPPKIKGSTSFNAELSDNLDHNKSLNSSSSTVNNNNIQDSAIIQIVTPNLQLTSSSSSVLANPVLLTPDAFINSPTNSNRSNSRSANNIDPQQQQQTSIKNDILQSLLINSVSPSSSTQSNSNTASNLMSSRTSSLTHVTAPLNNNLTSINNVSSNTNSSNMNGTNVVVPVPGTASSSSAQQLNLLSTSNNKMKQRSHSSSSSSSAASSSSSSSSSSSIQSYVNNMDLADKEVASLSAKNKLSIGGLNKSSKFRIFVLYNKI